MKGLPKTIFDIDPYDWVNIGVETTSNGSIVHRSFDELWDMYDNPDYGDSVANNDIISVRTYILILSLCCIFTIIITFLQCSRFFLLWLEIRFSNYNRQMLHIEKITMETLYYIRKQLSILNRQMKSVTQHIWNIYCIWIYIRCFVYVMS